MEREFTQGRSDTITNQYNRILCVFNYLIETCITLDSDTIAHFVCNIKTIVSESQNGITPETEQELLKKSTELMPVYMVREGEGLLEILEINESDWGTSKVLV